MKYYHDQIELKRKMQISRTEIDQDYENQLADQREKEQSAQAEINYSLVNPISSGEEPESENYVPNC